MKRIMSLAVILMIVLGSCGNLGKSEETRLRELDEKMEAQLNLEREPERLKEQAKKEELKKTFEDAVKNKVYAYDFIKIKIIKDELIERYNEKYYNKLVEYTQTSSLIKYKEDTDEYVSTGFKTGNPDTYTVVEYDHNGWGLTAELYVDGIHVDKDGNYYKGLWETGYYKNDFDENDLNEPYIYLGDNETGKSSLDIKIDKHCIYLFPNNSESFAGHLDEINKITVRNDDSGETYDIPFENVRKGYIIYSIITDRNSIMGFVGLLNDNNITISIVGTDYKCVVKMDHEHCKNVHGAILSHIYNKKLF